MKTSIFIIISALFLISFTQSKKTSTKFYSYNYHVEYALGASKYRSVKALFDKNHFVSVKRKDFIQYTISPRCLPDNNAIIQLKSKTVIIDLKYNTENECLRRVKSLAAQISKLK